MRLRDKTRREWIRIKSEEPILDVGCGDSSYFTEDKDFIGIDISENSDDMVKGRPKKFIKSDAQYIPFKGSTHRTVLLAEILEHVDNPVKVLMEAKRVSNDRVLITVPDEKRWNEEAKPGDNEKHKREYTGRILFDQCLKAGYNHNRLKIDYLNEKPFSFWLASYSI